MDEIEVCSTNESLQIPLYGLSVFGAIEILIRSRNVKSHYTRHVFRSGNDTLYLSIFERTVDVNACTIILGEWHTSKVKPKCN